MTAHDVRNRRFGVTRWREGYDQEQVDTLLDRVAGELDGRGAGRPPGSVLTPDAVVRARFEPTMLRQGYDQDEVDDFLDEVVARLRQPEAVLAAATVAGPPGSTLPAAAPHATRGASAPAPHAATGSRADRAKPYELLALRAIGWSLLAGGGATEVLAPAEQPLGLAVMALGAVVTTLSSLGLVRARARRSGDRPPPR